VLLIILSVAVPVQARTVGVSAGDSMVYSYKGLDTYSTPKGNVTSVFTEQVKVSVVSLNLTAPTGEFGYTFSVLNLNGTTEASSTPVENFTTVFDPYDNLSYLGSIGFWPITYTDLPEGSVKNLELNASYSVTGVNYSAISYFNASVAKAGGLINVDMSLLPTLAGNNTDHTDLVMQFNTTTGIMTDFTSHANFPPVEMILTYDLMSFNPPPLPPNLSFLWYILAGVVVVIVAIEVVRRKPATERKKAKMRDKLG
jgi:hypothetical protein